MRRVATFIILIGFAGALSGCDLVAPASPPNSVLNQGMSESLMDTGFYEAVAITRTIGRHYKPAKRAWTVLACFRFTLKNGEEGASCIDSFEAFKLDNDTWVVAVTINKIRRWRAIGPAAESGANRAQENRPTPN